MEDGSHVNLVSEKGKEEPHDEERVDNDNAKENELDEKNNANEADIPIAGTVFDSAEEVHSFYKKFALSKGFGIIKMSTKNGDDGKLKYYSLACARAGKRISTAKNSFNPRPSIKTNCKAKINVAVGIDGRFTVTRVYLEHNHALSPRKSRQFNCNKNLDPHVKRRLELNDQAGTTSSKSLHPLVQAGGDEDLNCNAKARQLRLRAGDTEAIRNYFVRMQKRNSNFFHVIDLDAEGHLRNVFWADARSRAAYESFGDVISFDTAYLTNKYDLPFASFVGVNHHGQSILLGCCLLSNESTETYVWLFRSWLECMFGRHPDAIVTDQCKAIQGAIREVFPNSRHRLCLWRIMKKLPEKLGGLTQYKEIKKFLKSLVYDTLEINEFEENWAKMISEYNLEKTEWLNSLYIDRHHWVPVFVKKTFWAGMSITQRSESLNAFFDDYVNSKTTLKQFVEKYDNALKSKIEKENKADFTSYNASIPVITYSNIEKQFQEVYTNDIFKKFQDELRGMLYCSVKSATVDGSISTFHVTDIVRGKDENFRKQVIYDVYYNEVGFEVQCSCHLFEFKGIICRHISKVLIEKDVNKVSSHYILDRWRKDIKRGHSFVKSCYDNFGINEKKLRHDRLHSIFYQVAEIGVEFDDKFELLVKTLEEVKEKLLGNDSLYETSKDNQVESVSVECNSDLHEISSLGNKLPTPLNVRTKGRPPSKRRESQVDQLMRKSRKKDFGKQEEQLIQNHSWMSKRKQVCRTIAIDVNASDLSPIAPTTSHIGSHIGNEIGTQESEVGNEATQAHCWTKIHDVVADNYHTPLEECERFGFDTSSYGHQ